MALQLTWTGATGLPVEADALRPSALAGRSMAEVARLKLPLGNTTAVVGELFQVEGHAGDGVITLRGDLRSVSRLGAGLDAGVLRIEGEAGDHLGAGMTGGSIELSGSAGDWAGAELAGGLLRIRGRSANFLGAAYPGSRRGMRGGAILVDSHAGADAGLAMRRGLIAIGGDAGDGLGRAMIAGSIFTFGGTGLFPAAGMKRGTLALFANHAVELPPTFARAGRFRPVFLTVYLRQLRAWGFPLSETAFATGFDRFTGDLLGGGQGEVLICNS
jgi:formylmethanofuran dehydrogenase subunit C